MDILKQGWFSEINELWPGISLSLEVKQILHHERSKYQDVLVIDTNFDNIFRKAHGRALILDGIIQCVEKDEFSYQEMIAFMPLCSHPNPKNVLIIGGGDGGVAREVAKHPEVINITQVEIDDMVITVSKQYLPFMGKGLEHPKLTLRVGDGFEFMKQHKNEFDIIITDSSDPVGPAESLFHGSYFNLMKSALKPNGIICSQAGTAWANLEFVQRTFRYCQSIFPVCSYGIVSVPTYPTGQIGFILGSLNPQTIFKKPEKIFTDGELDSMEIRYYSDGVHRAAFELPRFIEKSLRPEIIITNTPSPNEPSQ
ncbi:spermidine synthase isoform X1 [Leptopilina boulardi]|uniref:spermidine synthase isoform X1 n=2 Tax=Leptopilina boulardi TaxID=63433 RepID=UPI0021F5F726|nr:spermidine synthase isoform X1 [Leptopilina boulardi]XP_051170682.1 spermidine synthase isoform X1 [Leptopilina boulardi]